MLKHLYNNAHGDTEGDGAKRHIVEVLMAQ